VSDGVNEAFIDMGYDEPMVGLDYEGGRAELIDRQGWVDIRVVAEHSRRFILHRAYEAFARRGWRPPKLR